MYSMKITSSLLLISTLICIQVMGQAEFGNEWIHKNQTYVKFKIGSDALYRINFQDLVSAGFPSSIKSSQLQVWRFGKEVPIYISRQASISGNDYMLFWGEKHRTEIDARLFANPTKDMLNPEYSIFTDTAAYFITWNDDTLNNKRVRIEPSNPATAISPYILVQSLQEFHDFPIDKKYDSGNEINYSSYDECEGFGSRPAKEFNTTFQLEDTYAGVKNGKVSIRLAGLNYQHKFTISINGQVYIVDSFYGYQMRVYELDIANALLANDIKINIKSNAAENDLFSVSTITLTYPKIRSRIPTNETYYPDQISLYPIGKSVGSIVNVSASSTLWTTKTSLAENDFIEFRTENQKSKLADVDSSIRIRDFEKINWADLSASVDFLFISHSSLQASVTEYESFRKSSSGGAFNTKVVYVDDIYNQFGYGMTTVQALNNYSQYLTKNHSDLEYILLVGRALNYRDLRIDNNAVKYKHLNLVPTFGYPGADNLIFAKIGTTVPSIPMGRIAAIDNAQVRIYLNKLKEYESKIKNPQSNDDVYWRKEVLHSAGGIPLGFPGSEGFEIILDTFKNILQQSTWSPNVTSTNKASSDVIQGSLSNIIINKVNAGVSLYTYLGHGAISATEIGLDNPDLFNNTGKYPIYFTLGCNSGNIHTTGVSLSESFIFSHKGSIAYLSSSAVGTDGGYFRYGRKLFSLMGNELYDKSIGLQHYTALQKLDSESGKELIIESLNQQFAIHGDPSIQVNYFNTPDFTIDEKSFKTVPENLFIEQDSFQIKFTLANLGKKYNLPVNYTIEHVWPGGSNRTTYTVLFDSVYKTIVVKLPMPAKSQGLHTIKINLDPENKIHELPQPFAELNNELKNNNGIGISFTVFDTDVYPVYPADFGIEGKSIFELKAYTSNAFGKPSHYLFEIDTTSLFKTPLRRSKVSQQGGVIQWKPDVSPIPNTVYYWRITADSTSERPLQWKSRSFVYIPNESHGWNQSHSYQYIQNPANQSCTFDLSTNTWSYTSPASFVASSIDSRIDPNEYSKVLIDGLRYTRDNRTYDSEIILTIWDPTIGLVRNPVGGRNGAKNVFSVPAPGYYFPMEKNNLEERKNLIQFLEEGIQDGQYVIVITHIQPDKTYFPDYWAADSATLGKNLFQAFEKLGAKRIRDLSRPPYYSYPYVFAFQKGKKIIDEVISTNGLEARSTFELPIVANNARHRSITIGPASTWNKLTWSSPGNNLLSSEIILMGNTDTLIKGSGDQFDLSNIDANKYPYLTLIWKINDVNRTGKAQLNYWRILYTSFPDLAISSNENFSFQNDSIDQGDPAKLKYTIENIGDVVVDSFKAIYQLIDNKNNSYFDTVYYSKINPYEKILVTKEINTETKIENQSLITTLVAAATPQEINVRNNVGQLNYYVIKDLVAPVISTRFDGKEILNNEIISRHPHIQIEINDNKAYAATDSNKVILQLKKPGSNQFITVPAKEYAVMYTKNVVQVQYNPVFTIPGLYVLRVQGFDRAGNASSNTNYEIGFKIIIDNLVSAVLPYPNPCTSNCKFAYTLTGDLPSVFKIQIMTIHGKIVRELNELDLGMLREGTNITERGWDGTDQYGNKLATGTYLYRVIMKDSSGKPYSSYEEKNENESEDMRRFFTKGLGKIVLLR